MKRGDKIRITKGGFVGVEGEFLKVSTYIKFPIKVRLDNIGITYFERDYVDAKGGQE